MTMTSHEKWQVAGKLALAGTMNHLCQNMSVIVLWQTTVDEILYQNKFYSQTQNGRRNIQMANQMDHACDLILHFSWFIWGRCGQ